MYIQITTRCNMQCAHCCYSCTEKGEDMSIETFKKALELDDETISIGGGEPTIHPDFWEIIGLSLGRVDYVWLAINGKHTERALSLAKMAKKGVLACELSVDEYHENIDDEVLSAFEYEKFNPHNPTRKQNENDMRGIRDITQWGDKNPINAGRCDWGDDNCPCSEFFVRPNGDIYACGCEDSPKIGNVYEEFPNLPENWEWGECYKNQNVKIKAIAS